MKTIDRYIIKKSIYYLTATSISVFIFILIINFFEGLNMINKKAIDPVDVFKQSIFTSPFYLYLLMPLIVMISFLLVFNYFKTTSQYKAIYCSSYPDTIFLKNTIFVTLFLCILLLVLGDNLTTSWYMSVKKKLKYSDFINFSYNNIIFYGKLKNNHIIEQAYIHDTLLSKKIYAKKIIWNSKEKKWQIKEGYEITQSNNQIKTKTYNTYEINILPPPQYFIIEEISDQNSYSIYQLLERIKKLKNLSLNTNQEKVIISFRIGIIIINLLSVLVAYVIFKTPLIEYKGYAITFAIIFSLFIWFLITIFKRAADIEIIPAWSIAIIPHLLISYVLFILHRKFNKIF
ncbi:MAG: LptF/LptG family permease [Elusimicrobiales bacterium]|nr:LptF/LptG family permease [Elusimicrobiales bacterium]